MYKRLTCKVICARARATSQSFHPLEIQDDIACGLLAVCKITFIRAHLRPKNVCGGYWVKRVRTVALTHLSGDKFLFHSIPFYRVDWTAVELSSRTCCAKHRKKRLATAPISHFWPIETRRLERRMLNLYQLLPSFRFPREIYIRIYIRT